MKKTSVSPSVEISRFATEDVLNFSFGNGIVVAPPTGGSTEVGDGVEIGW